MNKAITDGLALMPAAYADDLGQWSSEDGTPGSATYAGATNASLVQSDADFGTCLEITKSQTLTTLRYMGQTPLLPGMYLRVSARVKAVAGNLPSVRIAGWAGSGSYTHLSGLVEIGSETALTAYGDVIEVSAIVGTGARGGVDMAWGLDAVYGHFGLDLTGANGGTVRIENLQIEDVTSYYLGDSSGQIDVRDFGAVGDGVTNNASAFSAADVAANGRKILVPAGQYYIGSTLSLANEMVFDGTVSMPAAARLTLRKEFHLNSYIDAFGDEVEAFKRAIQALFYYSDHDSLDMRGRRIELDQPIDVAQVTGATKLEVRRMIYNGQLNYVGSTDWDSDVATSSASYSIVNARQLSSVTNIANVKVGSLVTGTGVGREVYVTAVNIGAQSLTLSQPLFGPNATQTYTFTRFKYALDFSGLEKLQQFNITNVEFLCNGVGSGIMLAPEGSLFVVNDCHFKKPKDRGISSPGRGCQDFQLGRCEFISNEQQVPAIDRQTVAFNVNANDAKIRDSRFQLFGTTGVVFGNGHLFVGNHWFQGDQLTDSQRKAGLVFTYPNVKSVITGNYIDNSFIEMTNEHDAQPDHSNEYSFGGLTITGNIFTVNDSASNFSWLVIKPYGQNHFIQGLSVQNNTFKSLNGFVDRIDKVDTTYADLRYDSVRNVLFEGNTFNGISQLTINPASLDFTQASNASHWVLDPSSYLPFGGNARVVESVVAKNAITNGGGQVVYDQPYVTVNYGTNSDQVRLSFSQACKGQVNVVCRMDRPL